MAQPASINKTTAIERGPRRRRIGGKAVFCKQQTVSLKKDKNRFKRPTGPKKLTSDRITASHELIWIQNLNLEAERNLTSLS